jgi:ribosomal protein S18 acetylase RimI-like enzyme
MAIDVRPAVPDDARGIALVHVRGWQEAYAHLVPAESLARLSVPQRELRWREILAGDRTQSWVATDDGAVVGFADAGISNEDDTRGRLILWSIYILASHYGTGIGQRLLDAVLDDRPAVLWVADDNPRARAFYERNGFRVDGVTKVGPLAGTDVLETRMARSLC